MDELNVPNGSEWLGEALPIEVDESYEGATRGKLEGPRDRQKKHD
ncbi:MAG TPA: hypothetical protein VEK79_17065 [Thermoanaerobaculia bacterium]|nr:hypothetical protein [Thermoanaerobaculia bacterium]